MVQLRGLQDADLAEVLRIQDACYVEIVPESRASLRAKILASPATCFAAETASGVVGYLITVPVRYPELPALDAPACEVALDADTLYLHDLAVAEAGRGTGAASALVDSALQAGRARGLKHACLVAIQDSSRYWQRFGFAPVAPPDGRVAGKLASYGAGARLMRAAL